MRYPRISIAGLMGAAAIIALDAAALRALLRAEHFGVLFAPGILPMAGVLTFGIMTLARRLVRGREGGAFLVGFVVFGGAALIAFLSACVLLAESVVGGVDAVVEWLEAITPLTSTGVAIDASGRSHTIVHEHPIGDVIILSCLGLVLTLPQLAFATFGGWLAAIFQIRIVRGPRQGDAAGVTV